VILQNADDLLQDFAAGKILKEGWLQKSDPRKGRFRDFLRKSLDNLVWSWWKSRPEYRAWLSRKQKGRSSRSGSETDIPIEVPLPDEQPAPEPAAEQFNLAWAQAILAETLERMERDCKSPPREQPRRGYIWEVFHCRILEPIFSDAKSTPYEELVERFGLQSPAEASNMLLSAKRMFSRHLNSVIAEYERHGCERMELEELKGVLSRVSKGKWKPAAPQAPDQDAYA